MFESIKKKLSNFVGSLTKKEEEEERLEEKKLEEGVEEKEPIEKKEHEQEHKEQKKAEEAQNIKAKISATTKIKSVIFQKVKIKESDVEYLLEQLKISLLQSDVNYDVAERFIESMRQRLVNKEVDAKDIEGSINKILREALLSILSKGSEIDIKRLVEEKRASNNADPFRILFIGPNGSGKTTTIAKIANMLLKSGFSCTLSASDTFRAAAIEQTAFHAGKLGVPVIKGSYGADPASVAFDAIAYSKAHGIDVVLIDSAGRQETNKSLIEEMKKMVRIAKPDLKIFVGESIAGNSLLEQVKEFNDAIKLDGIVLTKLDCDAKGGNTLSVLSDTSISIIYFGTGESYDALLPYKPENIVDSIL
jgi:fused signal recognition particle receptor